MRYLLLDESREHTGLYGPYVQRGTAILYSEAIEANLNNPYIFFLTKFHRGKSCNIFTCSFELLSNILGFQVRGESVCR